jgi:CheY-like chemotaxis protein
MTAKPIKILLVDDDPDDVLLTTEELKVAPFQSDLSIVHDGVEAMAYLRREGEHSQAPRPDVVLLDLNMPRKNGREVLAEIRESPDLKDILVVVLTTSVADRDMIKAGVLRAHYINKPVMAHELLNVLNEPGEFFATTAKPRRRGKGKE